MVKNSRNPVFGLRLSGEGLFRKGLELSKDYQLCVNHVKTIIDIYQETGRILDDEDLPLHLEVDAFIYFVNEEYYKKENRVYKSGIMNNVELIKSHISDFKQQYSKNGNTYRDFLSNRYQHDFPCINKTFLSETNIKNEPIEKVVRALWVLNTVWTTIGRYMGGKQEFIRQFIEHNGEEKIRSTLIYILYGKDPIEERIYRAIYDTEYKLYKFGNATIKELVGWKSRENLPIINKCVIEVLAFYGAELS